MKKIKLILKKIVLLILGVVLLFSIPSGFAFAVGFLFKLVERSFLDGWRVL